MLRPRPPASSAGATASTGGTTRRRTDHRIGPRSRPQPFTTAPRTPVLRPARRARTHSRPSANVEHIDDDRIVSGATAAPAHRHCSPDHSSPDTGSVVDVRRHHGQHGAAASTTGVPQTKEPLPDQLLLVAVSKRFTSRLTSMGIRRRTRGTKAVQPCFYQGLTPHPARWECRSASPNGGLFLLLDHCNHRASAPVRRARPGASSRPRRFPERTASCPGSPRRDASEMYW